MRKLLDELYAVENSVHDKGAEEGFGGSEVYSFGKEDPICSLIDQTLRKYNGSRTLTAKELRMSTTTLWRKMKKYGLK